MVGGWGKQSYMGSDCISSWSLLIFLLYTNTSSTPLVLILQKLVLNKLQTLFSVKKYPRMWQNYWLTKPEWKPGVMHLRRCFLEAMKNKFIYIKKRKKEKKNTKYSYLDFSIFTTIWNIPAFSSFFLSTNDSYTVARRSRIYGIRISIAHSL